MTPLSSACSQTIQAVTKLLWERLLTGVMPTNFTLATKTVEMLLDPKSVADQSPVSIQGDSINQVTSFKYLGVHTDSDFSWHTQGVFHGSSAPPFSETTLTVWRL